MPIKAQDLITRTLRLIGAVPSGVQPTQEDSDDALLTLNEMLSNWSEQGISIPFRSEVEVKLKAGKKTYSMGNGGDVPYRPLFIHETWLNDAINNTYPFEIIDLNEYGRISQKQAVYRPSRAWYESQHPLGLLTLDSIPDQSYTLFMWALLELDGFSTLSSTSKLPDAYTRALRYNLAYELGPEYGSPLDPRGIEIAQSSFRILKNANLAKRVPELKMDDALITPGRFDIRTGSYYR